MTADAHRGSLIRDVHRRGPPDDGDARVVGGVDDGLAVEDSVLPASIDSTVAPAARIASIVATPTTGTSNRMSWFGLATLTTRAPAPASCPARAIIVVGAFHRLDGDDRLVLHAMVWPMSRPAMASAMR